MVPLLGSQPRPTDLIEFSGNEELNYFNVGGQWDVSQSVDGTVLRNWELNQ